MKSLFFVIECINKSLYHTKRIKYIYNQTVSGDFVFQFVRADD